MHVHALRLNTAKRAVAPFLPAFYAVIDPTYAVEAIPGEYSVPKFMDVSRRRGHHGHLDLRRVGSSISHITRERELCLRATRSAGHVDVFDDVNFSSAKGNAGSSTYNNARTQGVCGICAKNV